jgi:hypothetical protein
MTDTINEIAELAGALVIERSSGVVYGCMDLDLMKFAFLVEQNATKNCRDMFITGSVSWNLLNERYLDFKEESSND